MRVIAALLTVVAALPQETVSVVPTAVYTAAEHHTTRWAEDNPIAKIAGACRITSATPPYAVACSSPAPSEPRTGRRYFYSVVLFRNLEETLYLAACANTSRESTCGDLGSGQTFSAEVEEGTIRIIARDEQLPLRILERRPKPVTVDSPTRGIPSQVRLSAGAPSAVPYSKVSESRGSPSQTLPSEVSVSSGAPSIAPPSETSVPVASPTGARLYLYCAVGSARVYVDNQWLGSPPIEAPLLPGRHAIAVRAEGFREWSRTVNIPAGGVTKLTAELRR